MLEDPPPRVVLAVDQAGTRAGLRRALTDGGFVAAAEAQDAEAAVTTVLAERPTVTVVSAELPGGGVAAVRRIVDAWPDALVVVFAHEPDDEGFIDAVQAGAVGYLGNELAPERVPHVLRAVMVGELAAPRRYVLRLAQEVRSRDRVRSLVSERAGARLSDREWEMLQLLDRELSTAEIAHRLGIQEVTVRRHISRLVTRLGAGDRAGALALLRSTH
jgi:DNA-binding NarL/FixJ family response regulator